MRQPTWKEQTFLNSLPFARYKLIEPALVAVWFDAKDDPDGKLLQELQRILSEYGAVSVDVPGLPGAWGLGFRTVEALNQARQLFPLPARLAVGIGS